VSGALVSGGAVHGTVGNPDLSANWTCTDEP